MSANEIKQHLKQYAYFRSCLRLLSWDMESKMPGNAIKDRSKSLAFIQGKMHQHMTCAKYDKMLKSFIAAKGLSKKEARLGQELRWDFNLSKALPGDFVEEMAEVSSLSNHAWIKARKENSWKAFLPHLQKMINIKRQEIEYLRSKDKNNIFKTPYDALLMQFDKEFDSHSITKIFAELKSGLSNSLRKIEKGWKFRNTLYGVKLVSKYKPQKTKVKPSIFSSQTAIVVGDSKNKQINVDNFGRIKVQFIWRPSDEQNPQNSAWARVSQWGSSGNGWGNVCIPRVGQEVIVGFLNGDPDEPIVLGTIFNGSNDFPKAMPGDAPNLTFKQESYGELDGRYNEIKMTNKDMEEEILLKSQRNIKFEALNDLTEDVSSDRTTTIGNNDKLQVKGNRYERFGESQLLPGDVKMGTLTAAQWLGDAVDMSTIDKGIKINHIKKGMYTVVIDDGDIGFLYEKGAFDIIGKSYSLLTYMSYKAVIGGSATTSVTGDCTTSVEGDNNLTVSGANTINIDGEAETNIEGMCSVTATGDIQVEATAISITATADLNLEAAGAISIKAAGAITIDSGDFSLDAAAVTLTADAVFEISASAVVSISGAIVQLG